MPQADPVAPSPPVPWRRQRLPLLGTVWERTGASPRVLDCGGAGPETLVWARHQGGCWVILDLADSVYAGAKEPGAVMLQALTAGAQRFLRAPVGLALLWDLPDYLEPQRLPQLDGILRRQLRGGGWVHLLVTSTARHRPACPARWRLGATGDEVDCAAGEEGAPAPRHTPWAMGRSLPSFEVERTVLLQGGYQEYLLRRLGLGER